MSSSSRFRDDKAMRVGSKDSELLKQQHRPRINGEDYWFKRDFLDHGFGHSCSVCDRHRFETNLTKVGSVQNEQHRKVVAGRLCHRYLGPTNPLNSEDPVDENDGIAKSHDEAYEKADSKVVQPVNSHMLVCGLSSVEFKHPLETGMRSVRKDVDSVAVKYSADQTISRTPVIVLSNNEVFLDDQAFNHHMWR
ncbi:hypothetical protein HPB51_000596 [Rhipicephalus microplus]|uniref:Phospholipase A2-like domain-containing protein n=1 Tax=Rhipicephalus microplus TaxID=6941 RepID=A0A9J6EUX1_RHIMP|nr:hypothetical protein HPB51_000596 [Rhipicephalus microplus]